MRSALRRVAALVAVTTAFIGLAVDVAAAETTTYSSTEAIPVPPASSYTGSAGGDGWGISLSVDEVFNVFHHNGSLFVACHKQTDASACYPVRTITDAGTHFATSSHSDTHLDVETGKLWVYATRVDGTAGVVCVDTTIADTEPNPFCGFTPLSATGEGGITSLPMRIGERLYAFNYVNGTPTGTRDKLLCFDLSTEAACADQPFTVDIGSGDVSVGTFPVPATALIGDQMIIPIVTGGTGRLACFDHSLQADCAGAFPVTASTGFNGAPFERLDSRGALIGFCLPVSGVPCYDLMGAGPATPAGITAVITPTTGWNAKTFVIGTRVFLANGNEDQIQCFDYSTGASCTNFPRTTPGANFIYSVNADWQRPTCIWMNADSGASQIQNFDAFTGGACGQGAIRVLSSQLVIPLDECQPSEYRTFEVLQPERSGYSDGTVGFADANGGPTGIPDQEIDASGVVDLTGLGLESIDRPQFLITLNGTSGAPSEVVVRMTWDSEYDADCLDDDIETEHAPTTVTTRLTGGGQDGTSISVPAGTPVTDHATLTGDRAATAEGAVQYDVYSDVACTNAVYTGPSQPITTPGQLPDSQPVTLNAAGTYYWVATYSGDETNLGSSSVCGDAVLTITEDGSSVEQQIDDLETQIGDFQLNPQGFQGSFIAKLDSALANVETGDTAAACSDLQSFLNQVRAQRGKKLTNAQADAMHDAAVAIRDTLGC